MSVLISEISSYKSIVISKFIQKNYLGMPCIGFDSRPFVNHFHTNSLNYYHHVPNIKDYPQEYLNEILNLIETYHVTCFIPTNSSEMDFLLKNKKMLKGTLDYWGNNSAFEQLNDKRNLFLLAKEMKINTPETFQVLEEAKVPLVLKPTNLSSSKGVKYFFSQDKYKNYISKLQTRNCLIAQSYVAGYAVGYSVFCHNGKIITGFSHKRSAEYPISGGSSVYRENYDDVRLQGIAEKLLEKTKWSGFAMFEFKIDKKNEPCLIEVNPRIWGSINQGLQNGVNYFSFILPESDNKIIPFTKVNTYLSPLIYLALIKYALSLNLKVIINFFKSYSFNHADVNLFKDPKGFVSVILRALFKK